MKVGLLTFHNTLSHGAALQTYALQQILKAMDIDCEIIDYVSDFRNGSHIARKHIKRALKNKNFYLAAKWCLGSLFLMRKRLRFLKFYKENLYYTSTRFTGDKKRELNKKFDKFVVGSDQVWNYELNGADLTYFLDFVDGDERKIAYAASFGLETIRNDLKGAYADNLKRIKYLSVREDYGRQLIRRLAGRDDAKLVLDPVFLLSKERWLSFCNNINNKNKYKYIFCYVSKPRQWIDFLKKAKFSLAGYKIYKLEALTVKDFMNPWVKIDFCISPVAFVERVANASIVVSASFHCIAMSIILNVPFIAILSGDRGKDERLLNILKVTGLESRILNEKMTVDDINKPIDFLSVEKRLEEYKNQSIIFLKKSIFA